MVAMPIIIGSTSLQAPPYSRCGDANRYLKHYTLHVFKVCPLFFFCLRPLLLHEAKCTRAASTTQCINVHVNARFNGDGVK